MSAVVLPDLKITCPTWCTVPAPSHIADLDDWEGRVIHHSDDVAGWSLTSVTAVDGQWWPDSNGFNAEVPVQLMEGDATTHPDDAERLALSILELVRQARA